MKKIITKSAYIIVLPLLLLAAINYWQDPEYILRDIPVKTYANALHSGKYLSGNVNVDSRKLKKGWIQGMEKPADILVLGSSRSLSISGAMFPGQTLCNASVTNANLIDILGFWQIYTSRHTAPDTVIICLDQWLLNPEFKDLRSYIMTPYADSAISQHIPAKYQVKAWEHHKAAIHHLFSLRYFYSGISHPGKNKDLYVSNTASDTVMQFWPDGSRHLPAKLINRGEKKVEQELYHYIFRSADEQFQAPDTGLGCILDEFISECFSSAVHVQAFIPPYHPVFYKFMKTQHYYQGVLATEKQFFQLCEKYGIEVWGVQKNPKAKYPGSSFYDAVHLKPDVINYIWKAKEGTVNLGAQNKLN